MAWWFGVWMKNPSPARSPGREEAGGRQWTPLKITTNVKRLTDVVGWCCGKDRIKAACENDPTVRARWQPRALAGLILAMKAYDAQFFARCHKLDLRTAKRAARAMDMELSEFIRRAVNEKATRVASTAEKYPDAYRTKETVA